MKYIFIILISIFLASCAGVGNMQSVLEDEKFKPKIEINDVTIKSIDLSNITLKAKVSVSNFLPINTYIKDAMINIYYEDKIINSYKIQGQDILKARSKNNINLVSSIRINDLAKIINNYNNLDSIPLKLEVVTDIFLPNFIKENIMEYNLREKTDINIPAINPNISIQKINFGKSNIKAVFNLKNQSKANIILDSIDYELNIAGMPFSGVANAIKQNDNSVDIIIDNLPNSLKINKTNDISLSLSTSVRFNQLQYKIPLTIDKNFKE